MKIIFIYRKSKKHTGKNETDLLYMKNIECRFLKTNIWISGLFNVSSPQGDLSYCITRKLPDICVRENDNACLKNLSGERPAVIHPAVPESLIK